MPHDTSPQVGVHVLCNMYMPTKCSLWLSCVTCLLYKTIKIFQLWLFFILSLQPMLALTWCTKASIFTSQKLTTSHYVRTVPSCASSAASTAMPSAFAMSSKIAQPHSNNASSWPSTTSFAAPILSQATKIDSKPMTSKELLFVFVTLMISKVCKATFGLHQKVLNGEKLVLFDAERKIQDHEFCSWQIQRKQTQK